jgi:hypothetical protein
MSNIADAGYLGTCKAVGLLAPFLQTIRQNPHATLITLYLNAVMEIVKMGDEADIAAEMGILAQYLPTPRLFLDPSMNDPDMLRIWDARTLVLDASKYFNQ